LHEKDFYRALAILMLAVMILALAAFGQDVERKVKVRVEPVYPEIAKSMHLAGIVKIQVAITAAGAVKSAKVIGGNPIFVEPAKSAVAKWKFEPAEKDTDQVITFNFHL
jgi:TonB family protein